MGLLFTPPIERGSQWGGGFYGYRLEFWLFYGSVLSSFNMSRSLIIHFLKSMMQSNIAEMDVFTLETDYSCETGYPFDNLLQIGNTS